MTWCFRMFPLNYSGVCLTMPSLSGTMICRNRLRPFRTLIISAQVISVPHLSSFSQNSKDILAPLESLQPHLQLIWTTWLFCCPFLKKARPCQLQQLSPVKRICVFEHSVMTTFNCACPAIQRGQGSGFLSEGSSWLTACMSEQRRFWRDCADAQARLNLRCSHRR